MLPQARVAVGFSLLAFAAVVSIAMILKSGLTAGSVGTAILALFALAFGAYNFTRSKETMPETVRPLGQRLRLSVMAAIGFGVGLVGAFIWLMATRS